MYKITILLLMRKHVMIRLYEGKYTLLQHVKQLLL